MGLFDFFKRGKGKNILCQKNVKNVEKMICVKKMLNFTTALTVSFFLPHSEAQEKRPLIPADANVFAPRGTVTIKMEDGTIRKGIANTLLIQNWQFQDSQTFFAISGDVKLSTKDIKTIKVDPKSMGETQITTIQGKNYKIEFESQHEMSFMSAEAPFLKEKIKCLQIQSVVFDWGNIPKVNMKYMLIELKTGESYVVPVEFTRFKYFAWNHIRGIPGRYVAVQPCSFYSPMPILLEDYKIPSNEIVISDDEIASLRFKLAGKVEGVGSTWYLINVYKKNGEVVSAKTQADMSLTILYLTNNEMIESNVTDINSISFFNIHDENVSSKTVSKANTTTSVKINGVVWATCNVDTPGTFTARPIDAGKLYQWNRKIAWSPTGKLTDWDNTVPKGTKWEKANDPCPAGWRVPTSDDIKTLFEAEKVVNEWTLYGRKFTDKATGNSIFLPALGYIQDGKFYNDYRSAKYWSSTQHDLTDKLYACVLCIMPGAHSEMAYWSNGYSRNDGYNIRCVAE